MRGRVWTIAIIWAGWAALMLAAPLVSRARLPLVYPDQATSWTAGDTARDPHAGATGAMRLLSPHAAWDSIYYLSIAAHGFDDPDMRAVAPNSNPDTPTFAKKREQPAWTSLNHSFFPLYPWLMRALAWPFIVAGAPATAALLGAGVAISLLGALAAMLALADLARPLDDERRPAEDAAGDGLRAAVYLLVWPGSVFLAQVYTEGLFVGLAFSALALMRRRRWAWAAVVAALAVWTRSTGALLVLPFAWRWLADGGVGAVRRGEGRARALREGLLALAPVAAYGLWRVTLGHDFFLVESRYFGRDLLAIGRSLESYGQAFDDLLGGSGAQASAYQLFDFGGLLAGTLASLWLLRREPALALYGLALIALAVTSGAALGLQRFVIGAPALFLVPARLGRAPAFDRLWMLAGALGLGLFVTAFAAGFWAG